MMKRIFSCFLIYLCCTYAVAAKPANTTKLDSIAAIVNDSVITQAELSSQLELIKKQAGNQVTLPPENVLKKQVLDQFILRRLQLQLAKQAGIKVDEAMIDKAIQRIAEANKITVDVLYQKTSESGLTKKAYRKEIREEIAIQEIEHRQLAGKINVSKQEVDDFIRSAAWKAFNTKEYHLLDILIALPEIPTPQDIIDAKNHAESVLHKIKSGMSFQEAAMSESQSTQALQGGDLGWRKLPEIPPTFADELVHLKENGIMGPILTNNGFHIVKLAGLRDIMPKDIESQHKQVEQLLFQRKFEESLQSWITKIKSEAYIRIMGENSKS